MDALFGVAMVVFTGPLNCVHAAIDPDGAAGVAVSVVLPGTLATQRSWSIPALGAA